MYSSSYEDGVDIGVFRWLFILFAVVFYPLLVSIYTFFPPLIGIAGLIIIYNIDKNIIYAISGVLYLVHIDLSLTLPFLLSVFSIVLIHTLVYPSARLMIRCRVCLAIFLIMVIDIFYYANLFLYDFILNSKTIVADSMLWFYIFVDVIVGLLL
ncbi:hypothetical protein MNB_SV-12-562 [hydrothermal vent metagenome]|uniref:Uncharacterized protein n=1 Tax=hydrothermal vent metagenome TaxID=652676 RepID=A0A1W1CP08_9ZZZZ